MKKIFTLILCICCLYTFSYAQTSQLKGTVLDAETNLPLSNTNIVISGGGGTVTDKNGLFVIECRDSLTITISHVGFTTSKQKVACGQELTIKLNPSAKNLNEVEITATSSTQKEVLYQPVSIAKLSPIELRRGNGLQLDDAINANIPGVFMQRRTFSAGQQFNIRGYGNGARGTNGASSNFDTQGTKVYLNGIPITDAEGITLMDDIDFNSIGNVEVVKGPAGSLYGLAIAGVVNLRTMTPAPDQTSIGQEVIVGSYGLKRFTTSLQIGKEKSSLLVNYGKQQYDGFMQHTASQKDFVNVFGEFTPNQKQTINYYIGLSNSYDERNGELTKEQFANVDYSGNPAYIKNNAHSRVRTFRAGVGHTYKFNEAISNSTSVFGTGLISDVSSAGGWTDKSSVNYGLRSTFDAKFSLGNGIQLSGITGVEMQMQNAQIIGYPMVVDSFNITGYNKIAAARSNQVTTSKTLSAFTEWTVSLPSDFSITAGLGYSVMGIELNDRFFVATNNNPSNPRGTRLPSQYTATYTNMVSPHFALNKVINKQLSAYISYRKGYKAPVSSYFFIPVTGQVVTGLRPEVGTQYEIGTKGTLFQDRLNFQVAVFYAEFTDKMTSVAVPNAANTATSYVYVANGGSQKHTGVEIAVRGIAYKSNTGFFKTVSLFSNLAYSSFKYGNFKFQQLSTDRRAATEVDFTDKVVAGVPPITFNAGLDFLTKVGLYGNAIYSYRDEMYYTSDNLNKTNTYKLLNAKIGFQTPIGKRINFDAYLAANNITGNQNYAMVFVNQLPDAYLPAPKEINYFGGINVRYNF